MPKPGLAETTFGIERLIVLRPRRLAPILGPWGRATVQVMVPLPIQFLLFALVGWVGRQHQDVIEYLKAENRALREQLGGTRVRFTDAQRRRLARKAKPLGTPAPRALDDRHPGYLAALVPGARRPEV